MYSRETAEEWDKKVLEIAKRYKPHGGHQLRPVFVPDWWKRLDELETNWAGQLEITSCTSIFASSNGNATCKASTTCGRRGKPRP